MKLGTKIFIGIGGVLVAVAVIYFVLVNMLFSSTYEVLTEAVQTRGESHVGTIAAKVPFSIVTEMNDEAKQIIDDFAKAKPETQSIAVLKKDLSPFVETKNPYSKDLIEGFGRPKEATSKVRGTSIIAMAPVQIQDEEGHVGYVVYTESLEKYLEYRKKTMTIALVSFLVGLVIILIGGLFYFKASIVTRVVAVTDRLRDISQGEGDLTVRLASDSSDEMGMLARHFNTFVEKIQTIVTDIHGTSLMTKEAVIELRRLSREVNSNALRLEGTSGDAGDAAKALANDATNMDEAAEALQDLAGELSHLVDQFKF